MEPKIPTSFQEDAQRVAAQALQEDGARDISSLVSIDEEMVGRGVIEVRSDTVVAGLPWADAVLGAAGLALIDWNYQPGDPAAHGAVLGVVEGNLRAILRAERPLLNLLQRACGIAALTAQCVQAAAGTGCRILHTRKTTPGLRTLEVAAVLAGGGALHRTGLADTVLIKDNHWAGIRARGSTLARALEEARSLGAQALQVEVESQEQLEEACAAGADRILVDNQSPEVCARWVRLARDLAPRIEVEATGGITLADLPAYAATGVDFISLGMLTHTLSSADLGLEIQA